MDEFDQIEADYMEQHPGHATPSMQMQLYPMALAQQQQYPLAQVPSVEPAQPFLQRRVAGLPVWGWGLGVAGLGVAAFFVFQQQKQKQVEKNTGEAAGDSGPLPALPSGWQPSRSEFGKRLHLHLQKNGIAEKTTIYTDADDAKKKLKQVSPLVTIQCKGVAVPIGELEKLAKREGLTAIEHDAGVVGFYPGGGKKGKSWEEYIDALREEGQSV